MTDHRGALVGLGAMALMSWLARRPVSWWEDRPRADRPTPPAQSRVQGTISRPSPGRDLERP